MKKIDEQLNDIQLEVKSLSFNSSEMLAEINYILKYSHLTKRNLFFFKEGKGLEFDLPKDYDFNFIMNIFKNKTLSKAFYDEDYGIQIRGLQNCNKYFFTKSLRDFRETFCLNNYNLYINKSHTHSFKRHKDPYNSIIYFLKGQKKWSFDDNDIITKTGDILYIPSDTFHDVQTLDEHSMHVTSSYYALPISKNEKIDVPIHAKEDKADIIYEKMKEFFQRNFEHDFTLEKLLGVETNFNENYMFFHLTKPLLYIVGYGELSFNSFHERDDYWKLLSPDNSIDKELTKDIQNRLQA